MWCLFPHSISMHFLNAVFIEWIQYKLQEFCDRNDFVSDEEGYFFLKDHVTSVGNFFWWFVFLTFLKISLEWSSEYSLSPPAARAWLPAGSFLWLIPGDGWDRDSRLVFPLRGPLQPCWLKWCCREWMGWVRRKSFVVCNARCRWCSCFGLLSMSTTTWS